MQLLLLTGVFALVGIVALLLRGRLANLSEAPLGFRLAVGFGVGSLIALAMIVRRIDVLPDALEPMALAALVAALVVAVVGLALREYR